MDIQSTRCAVADFISPNKTPGPKRVQMSNKNLKLPSYSLEGPKEQHVPVVVKEQKACTYCKYKYAVAKKKDGVTQLLAVARPATKKCFLCNNHLCSSVLKRVKSSHVIFVIDMYLLFCELLLVILLRIADP